MHTDGRIAEARFEFRPEHVGFRQTVHGGLISTILDELMVWACGVATRRFSYCAEMTIRFGRPVAPSVPIVAEAELVANRRGRLFLARATLREAGSADAHAEATGKYIPMTGDIASFVGQDFADDPSGVVT